MKAFAPTPESKSLIQPSTNDPGNNSSSVHREPHMGLSHHSMHKGFNHSSVLTAHLPKTVLSGNKGKSGLMRLLYQSPPNKYKLKIAAEDRYCISPTGG